MENSPPDFPPLTPGQEALLRKIRAKLQEPAPKDKSGRIKRQEEIDRLIIRAVRLLARRVPGGGGFSGFCMRFEEIKGQKDLCHLVIEPEGIEFHPGLPPWAKKAFVNWALHQRSIQARKTLRKARIGFEKDLEEPVNAELLLKVLELRGIKEGEVLSIEKEGPGLKSQRKTRTRKEQRPWHWVIKKLVEGGLLEKEITYQALKKRLKAEWPEIDWALI